MKQWQETWRVLQRLAHLRERGLEAALATVVRVRGSAYRREGAKLLLGADGSSEGNVSGGCLEEDVREVGRQVLRSGCSQLRSYCSGADQVEAWDLGVGCEGEVQVLVEPAPVDPAPELALLAGDQPFAICTLPLPDAVGPAPRLVVSPASSWGGLGSARLDDLSVAHARALLRESCSGIHDVAGQPVFFDLFRPPPALLVIGAGDDACPLARLAVEMGFRVTVADRRAGLLTSERFGEGVRLVRADADSLPLRFPLDERCHAVVMTHSYADDGRFLETLLRSDAAYIGMLGPRQRTERLLAAADPAGVLDPARVHGPVGLDIGSEGAEQVALSIVAEVLAYRSGRGGAPLRERVLPIHAAAD